MSALFEEAEQQSKKSQSNFRDRWPIEAVRTGINRFHQSFSAAPRFKNLLSGKAILILGGAAAILTLGYLTGAKIASDQEDKLAFVSAESSMTYPTAPETIKTASIMEETPVTPEKSAHEKRQAAPEKKAAVPVAKKVTMPVLKVEKKHPMAASSYSSNYSSAKPVLLKHVKKEHTRKIASIASTEQIKVVRDVEFTYDQFAEIIDRIESAKARTGIKHKGVQIKQTKTSNIKNAFDLAPYLQSKGYIIAGREPAFNKVNGVDVTINPYYFIVTFGTVKKSD